MPNAQPPDDRDDERTIDLRPPEEGSATAKLGPQELESADPSEQTVEEPRPGGVKALESLGSDVRRGFVANGWDRSSLAALTGIAAMLAVGAVFVVMAKLVAPNFGAGKSPLWILARVGVAGLGALGIPIERGGVGTPILPLGALLLVGWFLSWATKRVVETSGALTLRERLIEGMRVALPFSLACLIAALVFRVRDRDPSLGADPFLALILGFVWGALFGAIGGLRAAGVPPEAERGPLLESRPHLRDGLRCAKTMIGALLLLSAVTVVAAIALKLALGGPPPISPAEAAAFILAVAFFLPNLVLGAAALALGGPLGALARTIDGTRLISEVSLLGWDAPRPGAYVYLLLFVPIAAFAYGGYHARRDGASAQVEVLGVAAGVVGLAMLFLVWISSVQVGRAFLGRGNYLVAAAEPFPAAVLGVIAAAAFGALGWWIADHSVAIGRAQR
jgi:hypothetical protein